MAYDWREKQRDRRPAEVAIREIVLLGPDEPFRPKAPPIPTGRQCQECLHWRFCRPVIGAIYMRSGWCQRPEMAPKFPPEKVKR